MSHPMPPPVKPPIKRRPWHLATRHMPSGTAVVTVAGEIDLATAPALYAALMNALTMHTPHVLDVDLSGCMFLDCSGLRVLVAAHTAASVTGCEMWVSHPQRPVRLVLQVTNLLDMFTCPDGRAAQAAAGPEEPVQSAAALGVEADR